MAHCTVADVSSLTQPNPAYGASTVPTTTQVSSIIDFITGEINLACVTAGYTLPISDADAVLFLKETCMFGAASLAEQSQQQQGNPEMSDHVADWWNKYTSRLQQIRSGEIALGTQLKASKRMRSLQTSHATDGTEEGISDLTPWVTRDGKL